ncbi:MAG: GTP cyclohydrolase I [Polyangiales bacterium]
MDPQAAAAAIDAFLRALGHDPDSDAALRGTGSRVAALFADELLDGHGKDVNALFADAIPAGRSTPLVVVRRLATHVVCPHHLTLGSGWADVAYLPRDRVLGLGTVAQIVDAHCHRLVLQEDACQAIARAFVDRLDAHAAMCRLELRHGCLTHHGEKKRGSLVTTIACAGTCEDVGPDRAFMLGALIAGTPTATRRKRPRTRGAPPR